MKGKSAKYPIRISAAVTVEEGAELSRRAIEGKTTISLLVRNLIRGYLAHSESLEKFNAEQEK